jgi:hypothetical protein
MLVLVRGRLTMFMGKGPQLVALIPVVLLHVVLLRVLVLRMVGGRLLPVVVLLVMWHLPVMVRGYLLLLIIVGKELVVLLLGGS